MLTASLPLKSSLDCCKIEIIANIKFKIRELSRLNDYVLFYVDEY